MTTIGADYLDGEKLRDPAPYFARLREEDPVHFSAFLRSWVVTRHDDVAALLRADDDLSVDTVTSARAGLPADQLAERRLTYETLASWLPFLDGERHARLRTTVRRSFTPRRVEELRPRIETIVAGALDALADREAFDVVGDYSRRVTAETMTGLLGVPREDLPALMPAVHSIEALVHSALGAPDRHARAEAGFRLLVPYFEDLITERVARPRDDLVTAMIAWSHDSAGSVQEIAATCVLLIFAGQETTTSLVSSSLLALLTHQDQLALVRESPEWIPAAVEEALRYWGIAWAVTRTAVNEISLHGRTIERGERVVLALGAANRDPRVFTRPDEYDLRRGKQRNLAFGASVHFCLGAHLGRVEDEIALRMIIQRFPDLRLDPDADVQWMPQLITRQLEALPLRT